VSYREGLKRAPRPSFPTSRQLTFRLGTITGARFAPDGNTLVYSAAFDGKPLELYTSRLERPESRSLKSQVGGRPAGIQSISRDGEMAILLDCELMWGECHDGTLARMPLVGGAPREIMEDVYSADWSPDGKELAVVRAAEGQYQLEYPIGKVLYRAPGKIEAMRVSPKGDLVAFVDYPSLDSGAGATVQVVDRAGNRKTLYEAGEGGRGVAWSPAGDEVWFSASSSGGLALYAATLSGRARLVFGAPGHLLLFDISRDGRVLVARQNPRTQMVGFAAGSGGERNLSWFKGSVSADLSADGKHVLFHDGAWGPERGAHVYLRKTDGSDEPVWLGEGRALALSPDGKWALALRPGQPPQLVLLPTGPGEPRLLPRGDIKEYNYASFFPDGQRILFTGLTELGRPLRSYAQDVLGGDPRPVTEEGVVALSVSPDGRSLLCWTHGRTPNGEYYSLPLDGGAPTALPGLGFGGVPIRWGADGRALYVREDSDLESSLYRLDLRGGGEKLLKRIAPDPVGLIGLEVNRPGGVQVSSDGKSYVYTYWILLQELFVMEGLK
jgi:Tol biopolymer transport system component